MPQDCATALAPAPRANVLDERGYFLMNLLYRQGTLQDVIDSLDDLKKMGISMLWISPVHEQTIIHWENPIKSEEAKNDREETNNHGYWVLDHSSVAKSLGGWQKFKELVLIARAKGIEICVDAVLNHFGYPANPDQQVRLGDEMVSLSDSRYFRPIHPRTRHEQVPRALYDSLSKSKTDKDAFFYQHQLTQLALENLPSLRHEVPKVRRYLIDSYKNFVEAGVQFFRLDAVKHMDQTFVAEFINELNEFGKSRGLTLSFIAEFLEHRAFVLDLFIRNLVARVKDPSRVYFLDFAFSGELRKLHSVPDYGFKELMQWLSENTDRPWSRLIPMVENHDMEGPITHDFTDRLIYVLSEFFSFNPGILFHGNERDQPPDQARHRFDRLQTDGAVAHYLDELSQLLAPLRHSRHFVQNNLYLADNQFFVIEKGRKQGSSLFLVAHRGFQGEHRRRTIELAECFKGQNATVRLAGNGVRLSVVDKPDGFELVEQGRPSKVYGRLSFRQENDKPVLEIQSSEDFFVFFEMAPIIN